MVDWTLFYCRFWTTTSAILVPMLSLAVTNRCPNLCRSCEILCSWCSTNLGVSVAQNMDIFTYFHSCPKMGTTKIFFRIATLVYKIGNRFTN